MRRIVVPVASKSTIHRLRAKLGDPPVIHTIPQAGYRV
ncbi:MAG TPA: helix-turn-helix domain-containing protein [Streptosporangiaceae bacterium]